MIHGLAPYTLQGFLWYQGESNADRAPLYGELIQAMVKRWRSDWHNELPFYYVELASFRPPQTEPIEPRGWGYIREAQAEVLKLPKTGVATGIDLGLAADIHYPMKKPLSRRLEGMALADIYGKPGLVRSPQLDGFKLDGSQVRLQLKNADGLRVRAGGEAVGFVIAGADHRWVWAQAKIDKDEILVWSDEVAKPAAVRYGWANNPKISIENAAGLPLRPFRTDSQSPE